MNMSTHRIVSQVVVGRLIKVVLIVRRRSAARCRWAIVELRMWTILIVVVSTVTVLTWVMRRRREFAAARRRRRCVVHGRWWLLLRIVIHSLLLRWGWEHRRAVAIGGELRLLAGCWWDHHRVLEDITQEYYLYINNKKVQLTFLRWELFDCCCPAACAIADDELLVLSVILISCMWLLGVVGVTTCRWLMCACKSRWERYVRRHPVLP